MAAFRTIGSAKQKISCCLSRQTTQLIKLPATSPPRKIIKSLNKTKISINNKLKIDGYWLLIKILSKIKDQGLMINCF